MIPTIHKRTNPPIMIQTQNGIPEEVEEDEMLF